LGHVIVNAKDAFVGSPQSQDLALGGTGEFGKHMPEETEKWAKVIKFAGIKPE
jgi:hypothetical protein